MRYVKRVEATSSRELEIDLAHGEIGELVFGDARAEAEVTECGRVARTAKLKLVGPSEEFLPPNDGGEVIGAIATFVIEVALDSAIDELRASKTTVTEEQLASGRSVCEFLEKIGEAVTLLETAKSLLR